jgi:hypothetical protein
MNNIPNGNIPLSKNKDCLFLCFKEEKGNIVGGLLYKEILNEKKSYCSPINGFMA